MFSIDANVAETQKLYECKKTNSRSRTGRWLNGIYPRTLNYMIKISTFLLLYVVIVELMRVILHFIVVPLEKYQPLAVERIHCEW